MATHGGKRPNSGRKSKAEELGLAELFETAWPLADRQAVVEALSKQAKEGNVQAASLLMSYAYGKPTEKHEVGGEGGGPIVLKVVYDKS